MFPQQSCEGQPWLPPYFPGVWPIGGQLLVNYLCIYLGTYTQTEWCFLRLDASTRQYSVRSTAGLAGSCGTLQWLVRSVHYIRSWEIWAWQPQWESTQWLCFGFCSWFGLGRGMGINSPAPKWFLLILPYFRVWLLKSAVAGHGSAQCSAVQWHARFAGLGAGARPPALSHLT